MVSNCVVSCVATTYTSHASWGAPAKSAASAEAAGEGRASTFHVTHQKLSGAGAGAEAGAERETGEELCSSS